jgi:hypothetical protein
MAICIIAMVVFLVAAMTAPRDLLYGRWTDDMAQRLVVLLLSGMVFVISFVVVIMNAIQSSRVRKLERAGRCAFCGYDRSLGANARCPECGRY